MSSLRSPRDNFPIESHCSILDGVNHVIFCFNAIFVLLDQWTVNVYMDPDLRFNLLLFLRCFSLWICYVWINIQAGMLGLVFCFLSLNIIIATSTLVYLILVLCFNCLQLKSVVTS